MGNTEQVEHFDGFGSLPVLHTPIPAIGGSRKRVSIGQWCLLALTYTVPDTGLDAG